MALNILHVLSSSFYAGSVAYAVKIAEKQVNEGCQVVMVTDRADLSDKFMCISLPVSNRSAIHRIKNIYSLKAIIRKYEINVVHAHSRAASWISYFALKGTKIPLVSTIHGRQVKKQSYLKMNIYGERIIAICPNLFNHLIKEIKLKPEKLIKIPNGIDFMELDKVKRQQVYTKSKIISIIGRFNGPKGEVFTKFFIHVFPTLLEEYPSLKIQLYGPEWDLLSDDGKKEFEYLKLRFNGRIQYFGFTRRIYQVMADSDLVIGAGRVALESMLLKVPVFAIGEACSPGFLFPSNINQAKASNFGDILPEKSDNNFDAEKILTEMKTFLNKADFGSNNTDYSIDFSKYLNEYRIDSVVTKILNEYRYAIMHKAHPHFIPILMYHKVPDFPIETKHRIFVTKKKFEMHLKFFKFRRLTSITFKDYYAFSNGELPIKEFPKKPFILTFDDGYKDNYENALPLMQKYGFKGVLFLLGNFSVTGNFWDKGEDIETGKIMPLEQKKAFVDSGWEIGAHTLSHPDLNQLSLEKAFIEMMVSKRYIEKKLDTNVYSFAYPYGKYNDQIKLLTQKCDFKYGIATDTGGMTIEEDHFAIFRINMFPEENLIQLYKKTSKWYRKYYKKRRGK